jgi:hypothetical protein
MKFSIATMALVATSVGTLAFAPQTPVLGWASRSMTHNGRLAPLFVAGNGATTEGEHVLANDELSLIHALWNQCNDDNVALLDLVQQALPTMSAKLIMTLKTHAESAKTSDSDIAVERVASALQSLLNDRLSQGRQVLATLLSAGELRKLDAEIGKANRAGKLDMAFFTVLDMNLKDAELESQQQQQQQQQPETNSAILPSETAGASRFSILTHIYTRCHEEVESSLPPGIVLLNKLLRTGADPIRANQLQYYLCPRPNVITLPDGQVIPVANREQGEVLVPPPQLVQALASTVQQIRTVETAGGMTRESAANMVEACRTVAKEARVVLAREYGVDSEVLLAFEEGLQPVFRPASAESAFIQGV